MPHHGFQELIEIDHALSSVETALSKISLMPMNYEAERLKFFSDESKTYSPAFTYPKMDMTKLTAYKEILCSLKIPKNEGNGIFSRKRQELMGIISLMETLGTQAFSNESRKIYGVPHPMLAQDAERALKLKETEDTLYYSAEEAKMLLESSLQSKGYSWKVGLNVQHPAVCLDYGRRTLLLRAGALYSKTHLSSIQIREISIMIRRYEIGIQQPFSILARGTADSMATEEGLAFAIEERNSCLNIHAFRALAASTIAIETSLKSSFRNAYNKLSIHLPSDEAFSVAASAKIGLTDTSRPGAFTRGFHAFEGILLVKKYIDSGADILPLYYGKVGLEDIKDIQSIPSLHNPLILETLKEFTTSQQ